MPGWKMFPVGMERSGRRRALLWGEGLSNAEPREGEFHGGHRGTESVGGGAFELGGRGVGRLGCRPAGCVLAGVVGCGGCCRHEMVPVFGLREGLKRSLTTGSRRRFVPALGGFVPRFARFVPACARFVPFWVLWLQGGRGGCRTDRRNIGS
jgi:hypothetical protein